MKKIGLVLFSLSITLCVFAQLPVSIWHKPDAGKPLLFYISGDGGMNKFSQSLVQTLSAQGFSVISLDAKEYFWKKKTPQQAALDVSNLLYKYTREWNLKSVVFIGYSFGADVAPFIFNALPVDMKNKIDRLMLMSPSPSTDFEVHFTNMLGFGQTEGESVVAQINKIVTKRVIILYGAEENDFPIDKLTIKNKEVIVLKGGHHYDGDVLNIVKEIVRSIK